MFRHFQMKRVSISIVKKYDKQDQQGKAAFNERNPHMTKQQESMAWSPGGPYCKTLDKRFVCYNDRVLLVKISNCRKDLKY
jgi:hypothetical protein